MYDAKFDPSSPSYLGERHSPQRIKLVAEEYLSASTSSTPRSHHTKTDLLPSFDGFTSLASVSSGHSRPGSTRPFPDTPTRPSRSYTKMPTLRAQRSEVSLPPPPPTPPTPTTSNAPYAPRRQGMIKAASTPDVLPALSGPFASPPKPSGSFTSSKSPEKVTEAKRSAATYNIISDNLEVRRQMEARGIPWGTQQAFAAGVSSGRWKWEDITSAKLDRLAGSCAISLPLVSQIMKGRELPGVGGQALRAIGAEYDREQLAIEEGEGRGLGLKGEWHGEENWYGGRIQQRGKLVEDAPGVFSVVLQSSDLGYKSRMLPRVFGSRRFIQVNTKAMTLTDERVQHLQAFWNQRHVLLGRVYLPLVEKEGHMWLIEVDEDYQRRPCAPDGDGQRVSLDELCRLFNPLDLNGDQVTSKWAARWTLYLSITEPVLEFAAEHIHFIDDIYAPHDDKEGKPPTEKIMTDGCGMANPAMLKVIEKVVGLENRLNAAQARVCGSKGLFTKLIDTWPEYLEDMPHIYVPSSCRKIKLHGIEATTIFARAHRIFCLVAPDRVSTPARLNQQVVLNLAHNGTPPDYLVQLQRETVKEEIAPLMEWSSRDERVLLYKEIENLGGVSGARARRCLAGRSRAHGHGQRFSEQEEGDDNDTEDDPDTTLGTHAATTRRNPHSGAPESMHEQAMEMLAAGFSPATNCFLYKTLSKILELKIDTCTEGYHIREPMSGEAFVVPDWRQVLKPGEIYFNPTGKYGDAITGDVLFYRTPMGVASDCQKVRAVVHERLAEFVGVIVVSTQGDRSLLSLLAGGDYDGDRCVVLWNPELVESFGQPEIVEPDASVVDAYFEAPSTRTREAHAHIEQLAKSERSSALVDLLLLSLAPSRVGKISVWHDIATYKLGYAAETTQLLQFIFNLEMDAAKSGHRLRPQALEPFSKMFANERKPDCMMKMSESKSAENNRSPATRTSTRPFILEILRKSGKALKQECMRAMRSRTATEYQADPDLTLPYQENSRFLASLTPIQEFSSFSDDLEKIKELVSQARDMHRQASGKSRRERDVGASPRKARQADSNARFIDVKRFYAEGPADLSGAFKNTRLVNIGELKASYAVESGYPDNQFPYQVAFRDIVQMKQQADLKKPDSIATIFLDNFTIQSSVARALKARQG